MQRSYITLKAWVWCFFNASCNKQVLSPKPWKKFCGDPSCCFRQKRKNKNCKL